MAKRQGKYTRFVHSVANGEETLFAVGQWNVAHRAWEVPTDKPTFLRTGCLARFSKELLNLGEVFRDRGQAYGRARTLFRELVEWEEGDTRIGGMA